VNGRVIIETGDLFEKLGFGDRLGELEKFAVNTCLGLLAALGEVWVGRLPPRQPSISCEHKLLYAIRIPNILYLSHR
jgi:hypothetical protein